jgi:hypothetical protein
MISNDYTLIFFSTTCFTLIGHPQVDDTITFNLTIFLYSLANDYIQFLKLTVMRFWNFATDKNIMS